MQLHLPACLPADSPPLSADSPPFVLEMQRDEDSDKKYSSPVYVTVVRAKKRCHKRLVPSTLRAAAHPNVGRTHP